MTLDLLRDTMIGKAVHDAKKKYSTDKKLFDETKSIIASWKKSCDVPSGSSGTTVKLEKRESNDDSSVRKSSRETKPVKFEIEIPKMTHIDIKTSDKMKPIPKRNEAGELLFLDYPNFRPNLTPKEVLQMGSFGGTYFRPIFSKVTGLSYKDVWKELPEDWLQGLNIKTHIASSAYLKSVNKYKETCGGDLEMWESSGWITSVDPYGWFMWYCRYDTTTYPLELGLSWFGEILCVEVVLDPSDLSCPSHLIYVAVQVSGGYYHYYQKGYHKDYHKDYQ